MLREVSQHTNIKLRHVALLAVQWGHTGMPPGVVHAELCRQLSAYSDAWQPAAVSGSSAATVLPPTNP
ncbi:hypothetical protein GCM10010431_73760 [Streptomyces kunmingensis]